MRILIVDDEFTSRRILENVLGEFGQCDNAKNGQEALKAFELAHLQKDPYDLITLDFLMPDFNGPAVLTQIRSVENKMGISKSDQVKVLMVTTQSNIDRVFESISAGCQDFIAKPLRAETLIRKVRALGFEKARNRSKMDSDEELTEIFLNELGNRIQQLQAYIESGDIESIQRIGHQLHGTGATYGFIDVTRVGATIEETARKGDWDFVKTGIKTLESLYHKYRTKIPEAAGGEVPFLP